MKIAIASNGKTLESEVSEVVGRAPFYLIFEDKNLIEVISNPFRMGGGGAGMSVAQMLINKKVDIVVGGKFGPNVQAAFDTGKIKTIIITNKKIKDTINSIID